MRAEPATGLALWLAVAAWTPTLGHATGGEDVAFCEYQTLAHIAPDTGEVRMVRQRVSEDDCAEMGAAVGEMPQAWRQRLPARVRWTQRSDTSELCRLSHSDLGERIGSDLGNQGCIFLRPSEACTIVSAHALSHAQLANAVRECAP